jgi:hypothetical protein
MRTTFLLAAATLAGAAALRGPQCSERDADAAAYGAELPTPAPAAPRDPFTDSTAVPHPHGNRMCASGCTLSNHPTAELSDAEFRRLCGEFAAELPYAPSPALDALLYYGSQTKRLATATSVDVLPLPHRVFLNGELQRTHAYVALRALDERGKPRVWIAPTRVPLDLRHVYDVRADGIPGPIASSGTVKRVGLQSVWQRI